MSPFVVAILLICSKGDPQIASQIEKEAIQQEVDPMMALSIGVMESGLHENNPMGVRGCYGKMAREKGAERCIHIGVISLRNRIRAVGLSSASKEALSYCRKTRDINSCRALIAYNSGPNKYEYGVKAMGIIAAARRALHRTLPET